jgi:hypothetical protein
MKKDYIIQLKDQDMESSKSENSENEDLSLKDAFIVGLIALSGILIYLLIVNHKKHQSEIKSLKDEKRDLKEFNLKKELKIIKVEIDKSDSLDKAIKSKLNELIDENVDIDEPVEKELQNSMKLYKDGNLQEANFGLVKIIENQLSIKYKNDVDFSIWLKKKKKNDPSFGVYLEYAMEMRFVEKDEYLHLKGLKESRNITAHEIGKMKDPQFIFCSIIMSFHFINKLSRKNV